MSTATLEIVMQDDIDQYIRNANAQNEEITKSEVAFFEELRKQKIIATVVYARRSDGGLRVYSDDCPGLVLSGSDADLVAADVWPALKGLGRT